MQQPYILPVTPFKVYERKLRNGFFFYNISTSPPPFPSKRRVIKRNLSVCPNFRKNTNKNCSLQNFMQDNSSSQFIWNFLVIDGKLSDVKRQ